MNRKKEGYILNMLMVRIVNIFLLGNPMIQSFLQKLNLPLVENSGDEFDHCVASSCGALDDFFVVDFSDHVVGRIADVRDH